MTTTTETAEIQSELKPRAEFIMGIPVKKFLKKCKVIYQDQKEKQKVMLERHLGREEIAQMVRVGLSSNGVGIMKDDVFTFLKQRIAQRLPEKAARRVMNLDEIPLKVEGSSHYRKFSLISETEYAERERLEQERSTKLNAEAEAAKAKLAQQQESITEEFNETIKETN